MDKQTGIDPLDLGLTELLDSLPPQSTNNEEFALDQFDFSQYTAQFQAPTIPTNHHLSVDRTTVRPSAKRRYRLPRRRNFPEPGPAQFLEYYTYEGDMVQQIRNIPLQQAPVVEYDYHNVRHGAQHNSPIAGAFSTAAKKPDSSSQKTGRSQNQRNLDHSTPAPMGRELSSDSLFQFDDDQPFQLPSDIPIEQFLPMALQQKPLKVNTNFTKYREQNVFTPSGNYSPVSSPLKRGHADSYEQPSVEQSATNNTKIQYSVAQNLSLPKSMIEDILQGRLLTQNTDRLSRTTMNTPVNYTPSNAYGQQIRHRNKRPKPRRSHSVIVPSHSAQDIVYEENSFDMNG